MKILSKNLQHKRFLKDHFSNCSQYIMKEGLKKNIFFKGKKIVVFFLSYCHFVKKYHII